MKLRQVLKDTTNIVSSKDYDRQVLDLAYDSRAVQQGSLFFCLVGIEKNGHDYIEDAIENGCVGVVLSDPNPRWKTLCDEKQVAYILVTDAEQALAQMASIYYALDAFDLWGVFGKTGTATLAYYLYQPFEVIDPTVSIYHDMKFQINQKTYYTGRMQAYALDYVKVIRDLKALGGNRLILPISKADILHKRMMEQKYACSFVVGDIDELEQEYCIKQSKVVILLGHTKKTFELRDRMISEGLKAFVFGTHPDSDYTIAITKEEGYQTEYQLSKKAEWEKTCVLKGRGVLQGLNRLAPYVAADVLNLDKQKLWEQICKDSENDYAEFVPNGKRYSVYIDPAWKPDQVKVILDDLKKHTKGKLIVVVGVGGHRSKEQRVAMAKTCAEYADFGLLTVTQPRSESAEAIVQDLVEGWKTIKADDYIGEPIRSKAIRLALENMDNNDSCVILGKADDDYTMDAFETRYAKDRDQILDLLRVEPYPYSLKEIGRLLNLTVLTKTDEDICIVGVSTDSRNIKSGDLFIALRGDIFDGHEFVEQAINNGATAIGVSDPQIAEKYREICPVLLVSDTLVLYQQLAKYLRLNRGIAVVAITGSVGKTSTRQMVDVVLSQEYRVHATKQNLNNDIGAAQTLLSLPQDSEIAVLELGMDAPGDIARLSQMVHPNVGIITNIGHSHVEFFNDQDGIFKGKSQIIDGMNRGSVLILDGEDPYLREWAEKITEDYQVILISIEKQNIPKQLPIKQIYLDDYTQKEDGSYDFVVSIRDNKRSAELGSFETMVPGMHHVKNALFAIAAGNIYHMTAESMAKGILNFKNVGNRQKIETVADITFINDGYNASLESVRSVLDVERSMPCKNKRHFVFAGIAELGEYETYIHEQIAEYLIENPVDTIYLYGEKTQRMYEIIYEKQLGIDLYHFNKKEELETKIFELIQEGDIIVFKGSLVFGMSGLCEKIITREVARSANT